jgi:hypothetical protein
MAEQSNQYVKDERNYDQIKLARDRIAIAVYPTVVEGVVTGRIQGPKKADGSAINPHFRAAINARNFADALLRALTDRKEPSEQAGSGGDL